jgi:hypothetical protein
MPWKECNPMDERLKFVARLMGVNQRELTTSPRVPSSRAIEGEP